MWEEVNTSGSPTQLKGEHRPDVGTHASVRFTHRPRTASIIITGDADKKYRFLSLTQ